MPWSIAISIAALFVLSPIGYPLRAWLLSFASIEATVFSWQTLLGSYLVAFGSTLGMQRLADYYLLLNKPEQSLNSSIVGLMSWAVLLSTPWQSWFVIALHTVGVMMLFDSYQRQDLAPRFLTLGLIIGIGSFYIAKLLLLFPLVLLVMYRQRALYIRHVLALIHAIVLVILGAFGMLGVELGAEHWADWQIQWSAWVAEPFGGVLSSYGWGVFGVLTAGAFALTWINLGWGQSVRLSEQLQSLGYMLIFGAVLTMLDASSPYVFASMLPLSLGVFISRIISDIRLAKHQRIAVVFVLSILLLILLLS